MLAKRRKWLLVDRLRPYLALLARILAYSTPILFLLVALHVAPVLIENALSAKSIAQNLSKPLFTALKLWGFFVAVIAIVGSLTFWSAIGKGMAR